MVTGTATAWEVTEPPTQAAITKLLQDFLNSLLATGNHKMHFTEVILRGNNVPSNIIPYFCSTDLSLYYYKVTGCFGHLNTIK